MYVVSRGRIVEAICSDNSAVDANKRKQIDRYRYKRRSKTTKQKQQIKKINERVSWLAGEEGEMGGWGRGWGDVYIIEFVCLMIPSREAGTFGSLYTK